MDSRYWLIIVAALAGLVLIILILGVDRLRQRNEFLEEELGELRLVEEDFDRYKAELTRLRDQLTEQLTSGVMDAALAERCSAAYGQIMTGSPFLDSLLTQKQALCRNNGIEFECNIRQVPKQLEDRALVGLFANLLDNAVEAALRCEASEQGRRIRAESERRGGQWMLVVENTKNPEEKPLERGMRTTKADGSEHGLGSKIIDHVVKSNKGIVRRTDEGNLFRVLVTMPMEG